MQVIPLLCKEGAEGVAFVVARLFSLNHLNSPDDVALQGADPGSSGTYSEDVKRHLPGGR